MDTSTPLYLAIDQGGHATRAVVFDAEGEALASASRPVATLRPAADQVEHRAEEFSASLRDAIREVLDSLGADAARVGAAGLATQRSSIACWDRRTGEALHNLISWQDRRGAAWLESLALDASDIHRRTGLMLSPHYGASKLRWCLDHVPAVQNAARARTLACGPLASFALYQLLEERPVLADPANASRTLLWNLSTGDWDPQLCARFAIDPAWLPRCVPTRHRFGHIRHGPQRIPLTLTTGDQSAALFGYGPPHADAIYINLGTGAFVQYLLPDTPLRHPRLLSSLVYSGGAGQAPLYALEGTVNGAGSALSWFADTEGAPDWQQHAAAWLADDSEIPLFINAIGGLGAPFWQPRAQSRYIGQGTLAQRFRAVCESILFLIQINLETFAQAGVHAPRLIVSGGISAQDTLCQWLADLSGREVERPAAIEATARGLWWLLRTETVTQPAALSATRFAPRANPALVQRYQAFAAQLEHW